MHALHHSGIHACTCYNLIFSRAAAKPAVSLQAETRPKYTGGVLYPALDEKMVSKNLSDGTVIL